MKRSKKIFIIVALLFFAAVLVVGYDISQKTSFPGSKKYLKESILPTEGEEPTDADSIAREGGALKDIPDSTNRK